MGEGWRALNIDFKDSPGQRVPAPDCRDSGRTRGCEMTPFAEKGAGVLERGLRGELAGGCFGPMEAFAARRARPCAPGERPEVPGTVPLQLHSRGPSSVPAVPSDQRPTPRTGFAAPPTLPAPLLYLLYGTSAFPTNLRGCCCGEYTNREGRSPPLGRPRTSPPYVSSGWDWGGRDLGLGGLNHSLIDSACCLPRQRALGYWLFESLLR